MLKNRPPLPRLFGNENTRHAPPSQDDSWDQQTAQARADAAPPPAVAPQPVAVVSLPKPRDPSLRTTVQINLAVAMPAGGQIVPVRGNCLLYADSTNGSDRLQIQYQDAPGDVSQPLRSMIPARLRRERYFAGLSIQWTVTAGAIATLEVYDDPDGVLYIQD